MSDERLANIETKLDQLISGPVQALLAGQGRLETRVESLETGLTETRTEMRVLHESTKAEIRIVAEGLAAHREETRRGLNEVIAKTTELVAPVTAAVAHHSNVLDDHEQRLRSVEEA